jgi:hypothetical protein
MATTVIGTSDENDPPSKKMKKEDTFVQKVAPQEIKKNDDFVDAFNRLGYAMENTQLILPCCWTTKEAKLNMLKFLKGTVHESCRL